MTPPPPCGSAEQCHGQGSAAPSNPGAGSAAFEGPGNLGKSQTPKARGCPRNKRKVRRGGKTRCVKRHVHKHKHKHKHSKKRANTNPGGSK